MLSREQADTPVGRHQRQNSTPTITDSPTANVPRSQQNTPASHRRGLSLDQTITPKNAKLLMQQETGKPTLDNLFGQHVSQYQTQETQQQKHTTARPGQMLPRGNTLIQRQQQHTPIAPRPEHGLTNDQLTALITDWDSASFPSFDANFNTNGPNGFQLFDSTNSAGHLDGFGYGFDDTNTNNHVSQDNQIQEAPRGTSSERSSQWAPTPTQARRPQTPSNQMRGGKCFDSVQRNENDVDLIANGLPMTPATTPFSGRAHAHHFHSRTANSSPTRRDPQLTIKASHAMQRGSSYQDNFLATGRDTMSPAPSPPHTAPIKPKGSIDMADFPPLDFFNMSKLQMDVPADKGGYENINGSPMSKATSSAMSSFQSSPEMPNLGLIEDFNLGIHGAAMSSRLSNLTATQSNIDLSGLSPLEKENLHRRSQSMSDLGDLEECIEDTGVTSDEIASFISGPDANNKWLCLYSTCGKKFGRKENIKSHVQTHLGDRQFRCRECGKCFVRQHDLKRHANIHTNDREYVCPCSKPFARQDALTRHRQRGMCIGAFEGTPRKIVKRGRPKKTVKPEGEDQTEKAKTRQKVLERMLENAIDASSSCSSSVSSHPSPPGMFDQMSVGAPSPSQSQRTTQKELNSEFLAWTPPASPGFTASHAMSVQLSQHSHSTHEQSQAASPLVFPELPMSRQGSGQSSVTQYSNLPELELSSSSPAASRQHDLSSSEMGTGSFTTPQRSDDLFNDDFFGRDFPLSASLARECASPLATPHGTFFDFVDLDGLPSMQKSHDEMMKGDDPSLSHTALHDGLMDEGDLFGGV